MMAKIAVFGLPGTGKTTLALRLAHIEVRGTLASFPVQSKDKQQRDRQNHRYGGAHFERHRLMVLGFEPEL